MTEQFQSGVAADGHGLVLFVPKTPGIADLVNPLVSELTGGSVKTLTYGLTPDGYNLTPTKNPVTVARYTSKQVLRRDGTVQYELTLTWNWDPEDPGDTDDTLGTPGVEGFIVHRLAYANELAIAPGQIITDIIPIETTIATAVPPTANTELAKTMTPNITGEIAHWSVVDGS